MENPIAVLGQTSRVRSLFSMFEGVNNPWISSFIATIPERFSDALGRILCHQNIADDFVLSNRLILKDLVRKFHFEADTLTNSISKQIGILEDPKSQILVSTHQPNLFAYGGVFRKIVLLETLKRTAEKLDPGRKIINLFLVVDHDFVDESWVRLAQLPSVRSASGVMELRFPISNSKRWQLVRNVQGPSRSLLDIWKRQIKAWMKNLLLVSPRNDQLIRNFEDFWELVERAFSKAATYADFNSFLMSMLVNTEWGYDTLFVRLSEMSTVFENGYAFLISNSTTYSEALRKAELTFIQNGIDTGVSSSSHLYAPIWLHCKCGSKASARLFNKQEMKLAGRCMSCKKDLQLNLGTRNNLDLSSVIQDLSPRAIPIPLLLSRDLGVTCYASGTGGIGYIMDGSLIGRNLSIKMPLIVVWPSRDTYHGIAQTEALASMQNKDIDIDSHLDELRQLNVYYENRINPLISARTRRMQSNQPIDLLLSDLFGLKEEQRVVRWQIKLAEKIRNAVNLQPCFIDYAVNFGSRSTEEKWRRHLLQIDSLALPVQF